MAEEKTTEELNEEITALKSRLEAQNNLNKQRYANTQSAAASAAANQLKEDAKKVKVAAIADLKAQLIASRTGDRRESYVTAIAIKRQLLEKYGEQVL